MMVWYVSSNKHYTSITFELCYAVFFFFALSRLFGVDAAVAVDVATLVTNVDGSERSR
jgi:hypothetical protein